MGWIHLLRVSVAAVIGQQAAVGLDNGAARRPPMGWLTWQRFRCYDECATDPENCLSERLIKMVADHLVSDGYRDAGYTTVNLDACWWDAAKPRDAAGRLVADPRRFPSGISGLVSYMEARGLRLGTYALMDGPPGGNGPQFLDGKTATSHSAHWQTDVEDLAKSGVHSIKVDSGAVAPTNKQWPAFNLTYPALGAALRKAGYNGVYTCSWPAYEMYYGWPIQYKLLAQSCNSWRNYDDIQCNANQSFTCWDSVSKIIGYWGGAGHTHNDYDAFVNAAAPGSWNDADVRYRFHTFFISQDRVWG